MDEPRQNDAGASLTDSVRQFRRVARLAAADPLRLLPPDDVLTQLASLSASVAELIDLAPFERLRDAAAPPASAARREAPPRMRPQPFPATGNDARTKRAPAEAALAPEPAAKGVGPAAAPHTASAGHLQSIEERPKRENASTSTLAERRAELRRRTMDAGSPSRSAAPDMAGPEATAGSRNTSPNEPREIAIPARRRGNDDIRDPARQSTRAPLAPVMFGLDDMASVPNEPPAPSPVDRSTRPTMFTEQSAASSPIDLPSAPKTLTTTTRAGANDIGRSPSVQASSSSGPALVPLDPRMPTPDAGLVQRPHKWELPSEPELADALFEALYRDGVDQTWP